MNKSATESFADEDLFLTETKPATTAVLDPGQIADEVTVRQCETQLRSIADIGASALVEASSLQVESNDQAAEAGEIAKKLNTVAKRIEEQRKTAVKPFNDIVSEINEIAKRFTGPFKTAAAQVSNKVIAWQNAERMRIAAEKRKAAEAAEKALLENKKPEPPPLVLLKKEPPKAISTRVTYSYEITDFDLVPDKYKKVVIDDDKLGNEVKTQQVTAVPGVKIIRTETPIFR